MMKHMLLAFPKAAILTAFFAAALPVMESGCTAARIGSSSPITTSTQPYVMAPLDSARIIGRDGGVNEVIIQQDGKLEIEGAAKTVQGMPSSDFRALLQRSYPGAKEIEIIEFRPNRVTVLGEVFHQIHTELSDGPMRVMDAIAAANGFTPLANRRRVRLVRQNAGKVEVYEFDLREMMRGRSMDENILLQPGDVITVPRNFL
jgi:polysaccharide export outer membrane protein